MSFKANAFKDPAVFKPLNFYKTLEDFDCQDCPGFEELSDGLKKEVLIVLQKLLKINGEEVDDEEERPEAIAEAEERAKAAEEARLEAEREAREAAEREAEQAED